MAKASHRRVRVDFWNHDKTRALPALHKCVVLWLSTGSGHPSCIARASIRTVRRSTDPGESDVAVEAALRDLANDKIIVWDEDEEIIWLVEGLDEQGFRGPKNEESTRKHLESLPVCAPTVGFAKRYPEHATDTLRRAADRVSEDAEHTDLKTADRVSASSEPREAPARPATATATATSPATATATATAITRAREAKPSSSELTRIEQADVAHREQTSGSHWRHVLTELRSYTPVAASPITAGRAPPPGLVEVLESEGVDGVVSTCREFAEAIRENPRLAFVPGDKAGQSLAVEFWTGGAMFTPKVWARVQAIVARRRADTDVTATAPPQILEIRQRLAQLEQTE